MSSGSIGEGSLLAGKYRLIRQIGVGAMGSVWVAENLAIEAPVAVKLLHASLADDPQAIKRFELEAKSAARLRHRNIVSVFDLGAQDDGAPFIVMELMEGESLERTMQRFGRLPPEELLGVVLPVLGALSVAHANQIVHRDLKPENLFLSVDADGSTTPKIVDFGVSKMTTMDRRTRMTRTGMVVGTPVYMPPEQARGKEVDGRADLWAVGVIMYEALSGHLPFDGDNYNTLVASILTQEARPILSAAPDLDPELAALVMRALERDPEQRYPTADVFAAELGAWLVRRGFPVPPRCPQVSIVVGAGQAALDADRARRELAPARAAQRRAGKPPATRRWVKRVAAAIAVVVAALGAGGVAFVVARGTGPREGLRPRPTAAPAPSAATPSAATRSTSAPSRASAPGPVERPATVPAAVRAAPAVVAPVTAVATVQGPAPHLSANPQPTAASSTPAPAPAGAPSVPAVATAPGSSPPAAASAPSSSRDPARARRTARGERTPSVPLLPAPTSRLPPTPGF